MYIFTFILGLIIGFMSKVGIDYYHDFILRQEKTAERMDDILTQWKAMELAAKEIEDWKKITHDKMDR